MNTDKQYDLFIAYHGDAVTGSLKEALVVYGAINGRRLASGRVINAYLHTEENRFGNFTDTDNIVQRTPLFLLVANEKVSRDEYGMLAQYGADELPKRLYGEVSKFREAQYLKPHTERGDAKVLACGALSLQDAMRLDSLFSGTVAFRMTDGIVEQLLEWIASYFGDNVVSVEQQATTKSAPTERVRVEKPQAAKAESSRPEKAQTPKVATVADDDKNYPTLKNYNHNEFEIEGTTLKRFRRSKDQHDVKIPEGVVEIQRDVFSHEKLNSLTIPSSVVKCDGAFLNVSVNELTVRKGNVKYHSSNNCLVETATKTLIAANDISAIPTDGSVTRIGDYVFAVTELRDVTIPNGITSIGQGAFESCPYLRSVHIPASVVKIHEGAFGWCGSLEKITVAKDNNHYYVDGNCLIDRATKTVIRGCADSVIPADGSVTRIGDSAFDHTELKTINLPKSITSIGKAAFCNCEKLNGVKVPNSVVSIGEEAFYWCFELTDFTLPKRFKREIGKIIEDTEGVDLDELCVKFV